ncbi:MAG: rRNA maturation RNase YbeY [Bdellovibrio bacteriovorus]
MELELDLQVETTAPGVPSLADLRRWAMASLEGMRARAELTIRVVGEAEGRELNRRYRGQDRPTNVLSFPFEVPPGIDPDDAVHDLLGDLVICADLVQREAREQGKPAVAHWAHLVVHGVLHLLDYDHLTDEDAAQMEGLETAILGGLGFPPPYQPDTEPAP